MITSDEPRNVKTEQERARMLAHDRRAVPVVGNGGEVERIETPHRQPLLASLENMQKRSNDNWGALTVAIHEFIVRQRNELDRLEHWLGTK